MESIDSTASSSAPLSEDNRAEANGPKRLSIPHSVHTGSRQWWAVTANIYFKSFVWVNVRLVLI